MSETQEEVKDEKEKDKDKEKDRERDKDREKEKEKDKEKAKIAKSEEIYQAGGHGGVVRVAPGTFIILRHFLTCAIGLVKKKTAASEVQFYRDFPANDRIPVGIKEEFFPRLESVSKSMMLANQC